MSQVYNYQLNPNTSCDAPTYLSPFIPRDLEHGEWELFCPKCGWRAGKMTACKPFCPDCRVRLHTAEEYGDRWR